MTKRGSTTNWTYQRKTPLVVSDGPFFIPRVGPSGPIAVLEGPLSFLTAGTVDRRWWVWDANSYYRDLGVRPDADRLSLRLAYVAGGGPSSVRLTFVLAQLLDSRVRAAYDALLAGQVFVDEVVLAARKTRGPLVPDDRPPAEQIADPHPDEDSYAETPGEPNRVDTPRPDGVRLGWQWGYWIWDVPAHVPTLREWQACLCRVFAGRNISCSVGLSAPRGLRAFWSSANPTSLVAFLESDQSPSDDLARTLLQSLPDPVPRSHPPAPHRLVRDLTASPPGPTASSPIHQPVDPLDTHQGTHMTTTPSTPSTSPAGSPAQRSFKTGVSNAQTERFQAGDRIPVFTLKAEELTYVQFFTEMDELISPTVHPAVPTKPAPPDAKGNWPTSMSAVCRNTIMQDGLPLYDTPCWICEHLVPIDKRFRPRKRTFGLGLIRSQIIGDGTPALGGPEKKGQPVGFGISKVEVPKRDPSGNPTTETELRDRIEYFAMGWQNFWQAVDGAAHVLESRSITKMIFAVRRTGSGLDTVYNVVPVREASKDLSDPEVAAAYGIEITVNPDRSLTKHYPPHLDIAQIILNQASDEYYERFFISSQAPTAAAVGANATMDQLAALQARLAASVVPAGAPAAPATPYPAPAAPTAPATPSVATDAGVDLDLS